ncbi:MULTISPECIES: ABC transporter permease [unclassified Wenzhouxiangella]|uniref:ABC transporter permease n=1 Tax=unclassified Wenzhouxiangella TaxID=2613841 RepID=UPI000E32513E|nr:MULTISPECIES: ABC transporter permease [unclassified Wenzhouxiangella]RFF28179.1 ABC transporter permease [Wenzhouxiangella sp. 15181]RFP67954.1 ABC transporter permease [Wenzhouxiangella sp. 15190]
MTLPKPEQPWRPAPETLSLAIVLTYLVAAAGVWSGLWGTEWAAISGELHQPPSAQHWLGTNRLGQDVLQRLLAGAATAFEVGVVVAVSTVVIGASIGGVAGFFAHGLIDGVATWLIGTIDAVPFYLFVAAVAVALRDWPGAMHLAMILSFWTLTARLVRTETMRLRHREFILAARAGGLNTFRILLRHIMPNLAPLLLVQSSLVFVAAVKAEVVLSFLGIGLQDSISWGIMIAEASQEILAGHYGNFLAASLALFGLVLSINRLTDRLQERIDPRTHASAHRKLP